MAGSPLPAAGRVSLAPGVTLPRVIVGCWQLAQGHGGSLDREATIARLLALAEAGFDTFDAADIYAGVEELLGEVAKRAATLSTRPRIRVHTKVVPDLGALSGLRRPDVEALIDRSRRRLAVEALDLVQLHWWNFDVAGWVEAGLWLTDLLREGKIRLVGVTNFDAGRLRMLLDAGVPVVSNQVQYSLLDRRPAGALAELCRKRGIRLLVYGTLAGGLLTDRWLGRDDPGPMGENRSLVKYRLIVEEAGGWSALQRLLSTLRETADVHEVNVAEVAARWTLDQPEVVACVTGVSRHDRIAAYRALLALELGDQDRVWIAEAVAGLRPLRGTVYGLERERGGKHAAILKTDLNRGA
jgi:aryl-alcohol dehydrogenase-like predicted oxidoreductase